VPHIVTNNPTLPVIQARKAENSRAYVVSTKWLWESIFRWERQDESKYALPGVEVLLGEPPVIASELFIAAQAEEFELSSEGSELSQEYSSGSSLDENFLEDLEKNLLSGLSSTESSSSENDNFHLDYHSEYEEENSS